MSVSTVVIARALLIGLGCTAAVWGLWSIPAQLRDDAVGRLAQEVIMGDEISLESLLAQVPRLEAVEAEAACRPAALRSDAIIRFRIAETTFREADFERIDRRLSELRDATVRALACSPSDSFLWLALYWVSATEHGFNQDDLKLLRMSYLLGRNEGWIIVKRNKAAMAIFPRLPPDLAERALNEFAKMFEPTLLPYAADIFVGPGWPLRDRLLARIADMPQARRQDFSNILRSRGYEIAVPGIVQRDRPWL